MSARNARIGPVCRGAAVIAAALTAAASYSGAALAAPSAPRTSGAARSSLPLSKVGPGWSVAQYSAASVPMIKHRKKGKTTLYLVSPQGRKFAFFSWPASLPGVGSYQLVDWSGDGQRVLLENFKDQFEQISLKTRKVISRFTIKDLQGVVVYGYTRPHGEAIYSANPDFSGVRRYDLKGHLQAVISQTGDGAIESPDGTSVVVGTKTGLEVIGNTGGVIRKLSVPAGNSFCTPARWWTTTAILADCAVKGGSGTLRLWLFPSKGGKVTALTPKRNGRTGDLGDIDAWKLSSGVYSQALGACGTEFIATRSGQKVKVPGDTFPSDHIITGQGSSLLVQPDQGCSQGAALAWFNPGTKHATWVLRPPANVIGVEVAVPFGRPLS